MRAVQFWILLLGSSFVSVLFIKQIFLSRALAQEQRQFVDTQQTASTAPGYEDAWKQLAVHIYKASREDPALAQVLKNENVDIHANPVAGAAPATTPSAPPASSKTPAAPIHPATP
jgi:hypothetical protein